MNIINVMAASLDGRIGLHDQEGDRERELVGLSGEADQRQLRTEIEEADAIIVGASSIRANGECLDHPGRAGTPPSWYVFAQRPLPFDYKFWRQKHIERVIVSPSPLPLLAGSGVSNVVFGLENPALFLHRAISQKHRRVLLFGGGVVNRWFYAENLVDELHLTLAPVLLGKSQAPFLLAPELSSHVKFSLLASHCEESFVFLRYEVRRSE